MVAIKDMEMPKNCKYCTRKPICKVYAAMILNDPYSFNKCERPNDCPLVEIITCENCSHYTEYKALDGITYVGCYKGHSNLSPNFYCADAERRKRNELQID